MYCKPSDILFCLSYFIYRYIYSDLNYSKSSNINYDDKIVLLKFIVHNFKSWYLYFIILKMCNLNVFN